MLASEAAVDQDHADLVTVQQEMPGPRSAPGFMRALAQLVGAVLKVATGPRVKGKQ